MMDKGKANSIDLQTPLLFNIIIYNNQLYQINSWEGGGKGGDTEEKEGSEGRKEETKQVTEWQYLCRVKCVCPSV